jgi:hypothetical protein
MRRSWIDRIRDKIRFRQYDMTVHALEEMAEDELDVTDVEHAVLAGRVVQIQRDDPRGAKCVLEGTAPDRSNVIGVAGRFAGTRFLIFTGYKIWGTR